MIDLPFALPTIVAGLTLLAFYGRTAWWSQPRLHEGVGGAGPALRDAPFVVRVVQPVLLEPDRRAGRGVARREPRHGLRRIILPNLLPAIIAGCGLAFARAGRVRLASCSSPATSPSRRRPPRTSSSLRSRATPHRRLRRLRRAARGRAPHPAALRLALEAGLWRHEEGTRCGSLRSAALRCCSASPSASCSSTRSRTASGRPGTPTHPRRSTPSTSRS